MANQNWIAQDIPSQKGKVVIVAGANIGLGLETARVLADKEAHVILTSRSVQKDQQAISTIKK